MAEDVYDRWHAARPAAYIAKLKARGEPEPEPCGCKPGGMVPSVDHGCDQRWQARWRDATGRQRYKNFPTNRKQAAQKYQRSQRAAVAEGRPPVAHTRETAGPTVAEYVETFLDRSERREGTVETYGHRLRTHVVPALGHRPVSALRRGEVKDFLTLLKRRGMADTTRTGVKKALSAMLSSAVEDDDLLPGNPCAGIRLSNERVTETSRLTWLYVCAIAEHIDPRFELTIWYGALQALRLMEAAGVRRQDMLCDLPQPVQTVEEQRRKGKAAPLKTKASQAYVPLGSFLIDKYAAHVARFRVPLSAAALRKRERRGLPEIPAEYDELVTVGRYWHPITRGSLARAVTKAVERARAVGIDVPEGTTFRDLRHFCDAVLIASNLEPRKVQARMRHATVHETMDTYGYLVWAVDWENAPASFTELYGLEAPPGLPPAALAPAAERLPGLALAPAAG